MASRALAPAFDRRRSAFESISDDVLAGALHDAGSNRHSARPMEVALHSVDVGFVGADADRYGFGSAAVRLQNGDHLSDLPGVQLLSDPVHARRPLALVRCHVLHGDGNAISRLRYRSSAKCFH